MIGYWLLPEDRARSWFRSLIEALAQKHDAPAFAPHVTLYSSDDSEEHARQLIDRIAASYTQIELQIERIETSEQFTKTLFVQFARNQDAQQMSEALRVAAKSKCDYKFDPHLSLLYAHLREETRRAEARAIAVPFDRVQFDQLAAVAFSTPIETRADVETWRIIASARLPV